MFLCCDSMLVLLFPEISVKIAGLQQIFMSSGSFHDSVVEDDNLVSICNGGQPMSDHNLSYFVIAKGLVQLLFR